MKTLIMIVRKNNGFIMAGLILMLGIIGARMQSNIPLFAMLVTIIASVLLVVFDKIKEYQYPVLIYLMCLGLVFQSSLLSNYLVGTDIHYEYWFALQTYNTGAWDINLGHSYNSAMSITVILPFLAQLLHIPLEWAFKIIPPLFLSGIPVIVYMIAKREFNSKIAFLSAFFLLSVPTISLELAGLAKQAFGELFLIACLGLVLFNIFKTRWVRYGAIIFTGVLTIITHYSMGGALIAYLMGAVFLFLIGSLLFKLKNNINILGMGLAVLVIIGAGILYYRNVAQGTAFYDIVGSASTEVRRAFDPAATPVRLNEGVTESITVVEIPKTETVVPNKSATLSDPESPTGEKHWKYPESAVALALGADFGSADGVGKIFRLFQYSTEILIVAGVAVIIFQYKKRSLGYLSMLVLSGVLLFLTAFYPGFSPILNASRFYNLALLFAAPALVAGGVLILRNYKALVLFVMIPYFIFTSGVVFEAAKIEDLTRISVPYSHALSALRTDSTAVFTDNDIKVRDWVLENKAFPIYGDMWGSTAVTEVQTNMGNTAYHKLTDAELSSQTNAQLVHYFVWADDEATPRPIPDDGYIILRERNTERNELTFYVGVGMRKTVGFDRIGFNAVLDNRPIVFRAGNAVIYGAKE